MEELPSEEQIASMVMFGTRLYRCSKCRALKMVNTMWVSTDEFTICNVNGCIGEIDELTVDEFIMYGKELEKQIERQSIFERF